MLAYDNHRSGNTSLFESSNAADSQGWEGEITNFSFFLFVYFFCMTSCDLGRGLLRKLCFTIFYGKVRAKGMGSSIAKSSWSGISCRRPNMLCTSVYLKTCFITTTIDLLYSTIPPYYLIKSFHSTDRMQRFTCIFALKKWRPKCHALSRKASIPLCSWRASIINHLLNTDKPVCFLCCVCYTSKEQHEMYLCNPSSHSRKYGEYTCETCAPKIDYWKAHKPVRFIFSYVLSVTQQYRQKAA